MTLKEAYSIIQLHRTDLFLQDDDHICAAQEPHAISACRWTSLQKVGSNQILEAPAVYTKLDAMLDNPEQLEQRCARGGSLKP